MTDIYLCNSYSDKTQDTCQINYSNKAFKHQKSCTDLNFIPDIMNSTSLPNSPSRDNVSTINNLLNSQDNSLSNSMDTIVREPITTEMEFLSSNLDHSESVSSKSQSSFNNISLNNQKRKKSTLFSGINNYRNKVISFKKIFSDSDASNDQLLGDYSCALAKSTHGLLIQGRLYVTEKWMCFYSKIMSFENKIILPISGITNVSKEKTAKVIPNAIQITTKSGKYFFTSFGSREKTFIVLQTLLNKHKNRESLNNTQKKDLIHDCYGSEADIYISEECNINIRNDTSENEVIKSSGEILRNEPPNFVVGDESDSDTDQSLYSSNLNHPDGIGDHLSPVIKQRKHKFHLPNESLSMEESNANSNFNSTSLSSTNESNSIFRSSLVHHISEICNTHEHFHRVYLEEEIDMHIDRLFSCLFTNSSFFRRFTEYRKTFDIIQAPWPELPDENGLKERTIFYTITMKAKIGPKVSASEEKQIIHGNSEPGYCYVVDTIVRNGGFPLSDCFHCINRYCLIHINAFKTKLKVTSQVVYDKSIFFASKSLIESTAKSGLTDYFNDLATSLKHEAKGLGQHLRQINVNHSTTKAAPKPVHRKLPNEQNHHQAKINKAINDSNISSMSEDFTLSMGNILRPDRAWLILIMLSLIICLCLSFLYSRFRQLEEITNIEINRQNHPSRDSLRFDSNYDWKLMLKKQKQMQTEEISQWKNLVDSSIDLIDQMRDVLVAIKSNLENLDDEIKSNSFHFDSKGKSSKSS